MSLVCHGLLLRRRARVDPTIAAVVADPVHRRIVDHRGVVSVGNVGDVHVVHRTIVGEASVVPAPAFITLPGVAVAIIDSAVETYVRTPVAIIEDISVVIPTPIAWGPQETDFRSHDPRTWHPVIIALVLAVSPVPRGPDVTLGGGGRLLVYGQRRRGDRNGYTDLRKRCCRHGEHYNCE